MSDINRLRDVEAIGILKARYLRLADTKDWKGLSECFCEDVVCDYRGATTDPTSGQHLLPGSDAVLNGREESMATIVKAMSDLRSVHQAFMPEIELTGENEAKGIWGMQDRLYIPKGDGEFILQGYGHYHETYLRVGGQWKIKSLRLVRLRVEIIS